MTTFTAFRTVTRGKLHLMNPDAGLSFCGCARKWGAQYDEQRTGSESDVCKACAKGATRQYDEAYARRQTTRDAAGRYSKLYKCDRCHTRPSTVSGEDDYGHLGFHELCDECSAELARLDDAEQQVIDMQTELAKQTEREMNAIHLQRAAVEPIDKSPNAVPYENDLGISEETRLIINHVLNPERSAQVRQYVAGELRKVSWFEFMIDEAAKNLNEAMSACRFEDMPTARRERFEISYIREEIREELTAPIGQQWGWSMTE